ncbi:MAG: CRTAC1 family protein [Spirochaetaceae bacterium]|nr:CRTAC1 family protein [Spirochaetaceae bacterium]
MVRGRAGWRGRARAAALVCLAITGVAAGAEVRLATCDVDARLCPEATGLVHPHAPAEGTHDDFSGGVSVGDFNRDGWQDLFVVTGGGGPDRLYLNRGDGTFREAAERAGVAAVHRGHGSVVGDVDRDGWLDIFVTSFGPTAGGPAMAGHHLLWLNLGSRRGGVLADGTPLFRNIALPALAATTSPEEPSGMGAAFGDYDRDGDLDLAVVAWLRDAAGSVLLNNQGIDEWTGLPRFLNATRRARLFDTDMHGFTPHIVDIDGDRWPEVLVAADFGTSRLYHNNGDGTFADATAEARVGLDTNGMGSVLADVDNDGLLDWYVTSIWTTSPFENPPNNGNYLYRNLGGLAFDPGPETPRPLARGGWGWGAAAADLDHDGLVELVTTNGSEDRNTDERQEWLEDATRVFHNLGADGFQDVAPEAGLDHRGQGRGLVRFDYDNDGDQDILIVNSRAVPTLVRNDGGTASGNWLWVELRPAPGLPVPPDGVGAVVRVRTDGTTQTRHIETGGGYLGSSELSAHFGLGAAAVDEVRVEWPDGCDTALYRVAVNRRLRLERPAGCTMTAVALDAAGLPSR